MLILMIYNLLSLIIVLVPTVGVYMYMCVNLYMYMLNSFILILNDLEEQEETLLLRNHTFVVCWCSHTTKKQE